MNTENCLQEDREKDIHLEIGARFHMTVAQVEGSSECVFVGEHPGKYLAVTVPSSYASMEKDLLKGSPVTIKSISKGRLLTFQTRFLELVSKPVKLVLLALPESIEAQDHRSHKRLNCFISAHVEVETEKKEKITGVIKDISKSGCCFLYQKKDNEEMFKNDEPMTLLCKFPGIVGEQEAPGKVIDVRDQDGETMVRIQFMEEMWWVPPYA